MPEEMVALRCKYCGAPLDVGQLEADSPYVTCSSCGTSQQRVDAEAYLTQLMGQVASWFNRAVPGGAAMSNASNVDPVARYNIYMNSVKPRIDPELTEYKFHMMSLLSNVMLVLPFSTTGVNPDHSSTQIFEFGAKLKSVEPLAISSQETVDLLGSASRITDAYALLINNSKLLAEDKPGRYVLMANNFNTAAEDFAAIKSEDYSVVAERFHGLSELCKGCETLLNGDVVSSYPYFERGKHNLDKAYEDSRADLRFAIMSHAVKTESAMADTLVGLADRMGGAGDPVKTLGAISKINSYVYPATGSWASLVKRRGRTKEIIEMMSKAVAAQGADGTIDVASGSGDILVPFWDINMKYSFQTGSLWKKHAVTVEEEVLLCADFLVDLNCVNNPKSALTDVFDSYKGSFLDHVTGNESSISEGEGLKVLASSASPAQVGGRKVIIPLSTRREAEKLAEEYLSRVASQNKKLRLSNPEVRRLIYVPYTSNSSKLDSNDAFGSLEPRHISEVDLEKLIVI